MKKSISIIIIITVLTLPLYAEKDESKSAKNEKKKSIIVNPTITSINKNDKKYQQNSMNPYVAGVLSIMPVWSGSFNKGFDGLGLFFVISKISSLSMMTYFGTQTEKIKADYQLQIDNLGSVPNTDPRVTSLTEKMNDAPNEQEFNNKFYYSLGALCTFILADIVYSVISINSYNTAIKQKKEAYVDFDLQPSIVYQRENNSDYGFNLRANYNF